MSHLRNIIEHFPSDIFKNHVPQRQELRKSKALNWMGVLLKIICRICVSMSDLWPLPKVTWTQMYSHIRLYCCCRPLRLTTLPGTLRDKLRVQYVLSEFQQALETCIYLIYSNILWLVFLFFFLFFFLFWHMFPQLRNSVIKYLSLMFMYVKNVAK